MAKKPTAADRHTAAHKARRVAKRMASAPRFEPGIMLSASTAAGPFLIVDVKGVLWRFEHNEATRVTFK